VLKHSGNEIVREVQENFAILSSMLDGIEPQLYGSANVNPGTHGM
jgi:hypothetical protein